MQGAAKVEKDSGDPTAEGVNPPPAKKQKTAEQIAIYNATDWCKRVISGKNRTPSTEDKEAAKAGLALLMDGKMDNLKKNDFAAKMAESHKSKTYGWVKEFSSSWKANKKESSTVVLNYLTRTADACMHAHIYTYIYIYIYICVPINTSALVWASLKHIHSCT